MTDFPPTANPASPPTAKALALEDWLVVLIMAALALITFANVLLRYFTDTSFAWTEEISIFLMIVLAMVGGSSAVARDQHIRIEFFSGNGSAQRRRRLARLGALMTALLFTVLAVLSVRLVWDDWRTLAARLQAQDVAFRLAPTVDEALGVAKMMLVDPDGYLVEIKAYRDPAILGGAMEAS